MLPPVFLVKLHSYISLLCSIQVVFLVPCVYASCIVHTCLLVMCILEYITHLSYQLMHRIHTHMVTHTRTHTHICTHTHLSSHTHKSFHSLFPTQNTYNYSDLACFKYIIMLAISFLALILHACTIIM